VIRAIVHIPDPVLKRKAKPVTDFGPELAALLDDMTETLHSAPKAIGLAAPQLGESVRVCVVDLGSGVLELVNPEIVARAGGQDFTEGCLSMPGKKARTRRSKRIHIRAQKRDGSTFEQGAEGLLAVAIQHEVDHLDGILMTERWTR